MIKSFIDDPVALISTPVDFTTIGCIGNCDLCPLFSSLNECGYESRSVSSTLI